MTDMTEVDKIANLAGAIAHLLMGRTGRDRAFIENVDLMVGGRELETRELLHFAGKVRAAGRPFIWVNLSAEQHGLPAFSLIAQVGGQTRIFECCMPYMSPIDAAAALVPESFNMGEFRFGPDLRLRHRSAAPKQSFEEAEEGIARAYERLLAIGMAQIEAGARFRPSEPRPLPPSRIARAERGSVPHPRRRAT